MAAAFECATFASLARKASGHINRIQRLERVGYAARKQFYGGLPGKEGAGLNFKQMVE